MWIRLALVLSVAAANSVYAQNDCTAVLGSVYDKTERHGASAASSSFESFFCNKQFTSFKHAHDAGLKVGIDLEDLPLSISGHDRSTDWAVYRSELCNIVSHNTNASKSDTEKISKVNKSVIEAWEHCIDAQRGLLFWAEVNDEARTVVFKTIWRGLGKDDTKAALKQPALTVNPGGVLQCKESFPEEIGPEREEVVCDRRTDSAATVSFRTKDKGSRTARIPPLRPTPVAISATLECSSTTASASGSYPRAEAIVPADATKNGFVRVGGGCTVSFAGAGSNDAEVMVRSAPLPNGWRCMGADPPKLANKATATATVIYCRPKSDRPSVRLTCLTGSSTSRKTKYPSITATIPLKSREAGYVLAGGGCESSYQHTGSAHAEPIVSSRPSDDSTGWLCEGADPPDIPNDATVSAHYVACRLQDSDPKPEILIPAVDSKVVAAQADDPKLYPESLAALTDNGIVTGGGCMLSHAKAGAAHAEFMVINAPADGGGWMCKGADPPGIQNPATAQAYVVGLAVGAQNGK